MESYGRDLLTADCWDERISEMDGILSSRDEILNRLDRRTGRTKTGQNNMQLRDSMILNFSKVKAVYKRYGFGVALHSVYDQLVSDILNRRGKRNE